VRRNVPIGGGHAELRFTVMPFAGGAESPIGVPGVPSNVFWADSITLGVATPTAGGLHFVAVDVRSSAQHNPMDIADSVVAWATALPDGWAWIPAGRDRIKVRQAGQTREFHPPSWYANVFQIAADPSGQRIFFAGIDKATSDSTGVGVLSLRDGSMTQWTSLWVVGGGMTPLADGSLFLDVSLTQESLTFFKLSGPGQPQRLGASPRPLRAVSTAADLKHATALERDYRADAWLSKVVRQ
jgi:hypothetical protein